MTGAMVLVMFLMVCGVSILFSFSTAVFLLVVSLRYDPSFLLSYGFDAISAVVLLCVPLYVCVGNVMEKSDIGKSLVDFIDVFVGRIRGGLGVVGVVTCAVFGSISGSSTATLTCIGGIMIPRMIEKKYPRGHAAALMTHACPLGLLIPPSASMILYAWSARQSILACFLATVIPGLFLMAMLSICNIVMLRNNHEVEVEHALSGAEFARRLRTQSKTAIPALLMPIIILGGTYSGIFTPTESAAVAVFYAIPVGFFIYRKLTLHSLFETFVNTASTTGVVMIMIFGMMILSRILIMMDLPALIVEFLSGISQNPTVILLFINLLLLFLGMIMDDTSAMLLTVPILVPIVQAFGISPVHLGAIVGVNLGLGIITPPCAPMLYLGSRVSGVPVAEMLKPTIIFIIFAWIPTLAVTTYFPKLSLWLPKLVLGNI
ncbi:MAG: TRAP transporter large permease [Synergistaceae bacterium]|nr:TRAP transporter large permease [Synergistaceae bacterium]